ncbi:hypothetical protein CHISP_1870 [Chitinispirillum alkaliphilum]|nr:hypothetical protein CHISP_1870 [Chitinispirillum alkaliphilum]
MKLRNFIFVLFLAAGASASVLTFETFEEGQIIDSKLIDSIAQSEQGLALAVNRFELIKLFGDQSFAINPVNNYPDVLFGSRDTAAFFWLDPEFGNVYRRDVVLTEDRAISGQSQIIDSYIPHQYSYLKAAGTLDNPLVSLIERVAPGSGNLRLILNNGTERLVLDSARTLVRFHSSMTELSDDTFLVVNSKNMDTLMLRKVYSRGSELRTVSSAVVSTGASVDGDCLMNPSVAVDKSSGNILVTWTRGAPMGDKIFHYRIYDRELNPVINTVNTGEVISAWAYNYYADAPAVSFAPNRFAVSTWNLQGTHLHEINGTDGQRTKREIAGKQGISGSAITTNGEFLAVVYRDTINSVIEAKRIPVNNGELGSEQFIQISDPGRTITKENTHSIALNCDMDSSGSIAVVWRNGLQVEGAILARRGVREGEGTWVSQVKNIENVNGDSLRFYPAEYVFSGEMSSWQIIDSVRFGNSPQETASAHWVPLYELSALSGARGTYSHFQYKFSLQRVPGGDSLITPVVTEVNIPWNRKPVFVNPDSVTVNQTHLADVEYGDTITILSRTDTVKISFSIRDYDLDDTLHIRADYTTADTSFTNSEGPYFHSTVNIAPFPQSSAQYQVELQARDRYFWEAEPVSLLFLTRNSAPVLDFRAEMAAPGEQKQLSVITDSMKIVFQEDDSLRLLLGISDTNDPSTAKGRLSIFQNGAEESVDSVVAGSSEREIFLYPDQFPDPVWTRLQFSGTDPDTVVKINAFTRINHIPRIISAQLGDEKATQYGDSIRMVPGKETPLILHTEDPDLVIEDTLTYTLQTAQWDTTFSTTDPVFTIPITPVESDTFMIIKVRDIYNRSDSLKFSFRYPRLLSDTTFIPYLEAKDSLASGISLIHGSLDTATVTLPFLNSGNDSMQILSVSLAATSSRWLTFDAPQDGENVTFSSLNTLQFYPVTIMGGDQVDFLFRLTADGIIGDGVMHDTLIVQTSDPLVPFDTIPISMEYNDLPRILRVNVEFDPEVPYRPASAANTLSAQPYSFPPHAKIRIDFSEPIDSASAWEEIHLYSIFDSLHTGSALLHTTSHVWNNSYTSLEIGANYTHSSPYFGFTPPGGIFIPTDSLALVLSHGVTDKAQTPSGPNGLDLLRINKRAPYSDTTFLFRVDSIPFSVTSVSPAPGDTGLKNSPPVVINFSLPPDPETIDTSLTYNRTIHLTSVFGGEEQVTFDSVRVHQASVMAYPSRRFFYGDTVNLRFRSAEVRDFLGFPPDNTGDGIPGALFDPQSEKDDLMWSFVIRNNKILTVSPQEGSIIEKVSPPITITFSHPIFSGTFDTDTSIHNRSMEIVSRYGGSAKSSFTHIAISDDSTEVTIIPSFNFFSYDSVLCVFNGFTMDYDYNAEINLPGEFNSSEYEWYFYTGETGFYTYPNPFRPNKDPRHCPEPALCGIWFKNLHLLDPDALELRIRIFNIKAVEVYDTKSAGVRVRFTPRSSEMRPEWLWDTRNQAGHEVASGVYFYVVYNMDNRALLRGKLMIVR